MRDVPMYERSRMGGCVFSSVPGSLIDGVEKVGMWGNHSRIGGGAPRSPPKPMLPLSGERMCKPDAETVAEECGVAR